VKPTHPEVLVATLGEGQPATGSTDVTGVARISAAEIGGRRRR
jgi:hypothetical protein